MAKWGLIWLLICLPASCGDWLKVIIRDGDLPGGKAILIADYGSYRLFRIRSADYAKLPEPLRSAWPPLTTDLLRFSNHTFATTAGEPDIPPHLRVRPGDRPSLQLVQFTGPIRADWLERVVAAGGTPVHYIADNGYLVWAGQDARARLERLAAAGEILQYSRLFHSYFKLGPELFAMEVEGIEGPDQVVVTIQVYDHPGRDETEAFIDDRIFQRFTAWQPLLGYRNSVVAIPASAVVPIAARPDVVWLGLRHEREMHDEVQAQILAGALDPPRMGPSAPGYLAFLQGLGFSSITQTYPLLEIVDDGIGNGLLLSGDPTFHRFGLTANPSRLIYIANCTAATGGAGDNGHGHLNASIAGGYDTRQGAPFRDAEGYNRGLGINPFVPLAGTRIFHPAFDLSACGGSEIALIQASYRKGARISNNSWGCRTCAAIYDDTSQAYDAGVRDADGETAGNQPLIFVFSAGNSGPASASVSTPGNGKNMITVGASESDRPGWTDGCGWGPTNADNAMDLAVFSSRGPAPGGRVKPELVAPGTHVQGTASTSAAYDGFFICDPFQPIGQTVFAASSGTSHAAPAVAGLASLIYWWLRNVLPPEGGSSEPSPAVTKAYLMAHAATYLTGSGAGGTLPSFGQGYGMPALDTCFDDAARFVLDQTEILDNSGDVFTVQGSIPDNSAPVRVALAYTDMPGVIGTEPMVNNLDLEVRVGAETYRGNRFSGAWSTTGGVADPANNYEAVFLPAGTTGNVTIRVIGFNIAGDGVPGQGDATDQDFAIVGYNFTRTPDYSLSITPAVKTVCAPEDALFHIAVGQILGFSGNVNLSVSGVPPGATAMFDSSPVTPPGSATLSLTDTDAIEPGMYPLDITATAASGSKTRRVLLVVDELAPEAPTLASPGDGALDVNRHLVALTWSASARASTYEVALAADEGFSQILFEQTTAETTAIVDVDLDPLTRYHWRVRGLNSCGEGAFSAVSTFRTFLRADYFSEQFEDDNDLSYRRLYFIPNGSGNYFRACTTAAVAFGTDPVGGTAMFLSDDGSQLVRPAAAVTLFGISYDRFYIGANGYLTFGAGDSNPNESYENHFDLARISALFDDLDPSAGGAVSWRELADRIAVTYDNVPQQGKVGGNSFQIEMFFTGEIRLTFLEIAAADGLVGLSRGAGVPDDFLATDLSALPGDVNGDGIVDNADFGSALADWAQQPPPFDYTDNGRLDVADLVVLLNLTGHCP